MPCRSGPLPHIPASACFRASPWLLSRIGGLMTAAAATVKFGCHMRLSSSASPEATGSPITRCPRWRARATYTRTENICLASLARGFCAAAVQTVSNSWHMAALCGWQGEAATHPLSRLQFCVVVCNAQDDSCVAVFPSMPSQLPQVQLESASGRPPLPRHPCS